MKNFLILSVFTFMMVACSTDCSTEVDISQNKTTTNFNRIDISLRQVKTQSEMQTYLQENVFIRDYLLKTVYPNEGIMSQELLKLATSPEIQPLFDEVNTTFGDFSSTETEISDLMKRVNVFFPDFKAPEINTLVTGFGGIDMAQGEDVIFIGLDYFLGPKAKFIPNKYPNYILKYFTKERLPYKVALMLSKRFNETDPKDKSLLSYMVYYGKSYYFASKTLPCLKEDEIVEYTTQELKDVHDFTSIIWSHFINKQLFYTTDAKAVTKYVDERPAVNEIGERCPGRIGRWLGYEIVKKYMENHPDLSLQDLMKETNAQKIFKQSKYKPGA